MPTPPNHVVVHPLVLLSTVDHYHRVALDTKKRVVGILLGSNERGRIEVTNGYAVPFEEDEKNPKIWFLDHNYHENMYSMFKKVNARELVIGWYSTGPKIRPSDIEINEMLKQYCPNPVFVVIDVKPSEVGLPTKAYTSVEEVSADGKQTTMTFKHLPCEIGAVEAEEVGVEHLLRDIKDTTISTLATQLQSKHLALRSLELHLREMKEYIDHVQSGRLPPNHAIITQLQEIFNLAPNLNAEGLSKAFAVKANDMMLVIYLSAMIRSVIALHNLINNKLQNRNAEKSEAEKEKEKREGTEDKEKGKEEKENQGNKEKEKEAQKGKEKETKKEASK